MVEALCIVIDRCPKERTCKMESQTIEKIKVKDEEVNISSKERTLIDLIYFNEPVGGIISVYKIFAEIVKSNKCDIKKLVKHAVCFPNIKTRKPSY